MKSLIVRVERKHGAIVRRKLVNTLVGILRIELVGCSHLSICEGKIVGITTL